MGRYELSLATPEDDAELRAILAATPMPGRIAVSFRREPSFFDAAVVGVRSPISTARRGSEPPRSDLDSSNGHREFRPVSKFEI